MYGYVSGLQRNGVRDLPAVVNIKGRVDLGKILQQCGGLGVVRWRARILVAWKDSAANGIV